MVKVREQNKKLSCDWLKLENRKGINLILNLLKILLNVVSEVLAGLSQERLQITLRILLLEVVQFLETHLGQLLLTNLLEDLHQGLVITLGELGDLLLVPGGWHGLGLDTSGGCGSIFTAHSSVDQFPRRKY